MVGRLKQKLGEVAWQVVTMFAIAFIAITIAYILTEMPPEQYVALVQLVLSFFAGYVAGRVHGSPGCCE